MADPIGTELLSHVEEYLLTFDPRWLAYLLEAPRVHLAILQEPYLGLIMDGRKTIESRFTAHRVLPYEAAGTGDVVLLKRSGGPVLGAFRVALAEFFALSPETWPKVHARVAGICPQTSDFWESRADKRYASLLHVGDVRSLPAADFKKRDQRAWIVLRGGNAGPQTSLFGVANA